MQWRVGSVFGACVVTGVLAACEHVTPVAPGPEVVALVPGSSGSSAEPVPDHASVCTVREAARRLTCVAGVILHTSLREATVTIAHPLELHVVMPGGHLFAVDLHALEFRLRTAPEDRGVQRVLDAWLRDTVRAVRRE